MEATRQDKLEEVFGQESKDQETEVMRACSVALTPLDAAARGRCLRWLIAYLVSNGGIQGLTGLE